MSISIRKNAISFANVSLNGFRNKYSFNTFAQCVNLSRSYSTPAHSVEEKTLENALPASKIPGLRSLPLVGSSFAFLLRKDFDNKRLHKFWENAIKEFGPTVRFDLPGQAPFIVISKVEDVEKVYNTTKDNPIRNAFSSMKKARYDEKDNFFEKKGGIISENNEEWWRVRSQVQTPLLKPKNVVKFVPQMDQVALQFMDRISEFQKEFGEMPSNFVEELYKWALESVSLVALNRRVGCLDPNLPEDSTPMKLIAAVNELLLCLNETELNIPFWRFYQTSAFKGLKKNNDIILKIVVESINEAEKELKTKLDEQREMTLLEVLMQNENLSRKDVITMILDMMVAGIDTTSHAIAFTLYLLARNPNAQKRLQEEVDSVLGDGKEPLTESQIARMSFLKSCVKESLRLFPLVTGHMRCLLSDVVLDGYLVPKGYNVIMLNYALTKDESLFPRPHEFLPERWSRDQPLGNIHPYAHLPFSHGTRMCVGRRIAEQEMYIFLARAMQRYNVDYKYDDMDMKTRLVSVPSQPLRFEFRERKI